MTDLRPCPGCRRHVASEEQVCPFCSTTLAVASPRDARWGRLSRAAVFAGAALASTACGGKKAKTETIDNNSNAAQTDAGTEQEPDRSVGDPNNTPMPYGAPPARRRVV